MVGITPFSKRRWEAILALYWPKLTKLSGEKWFSHTNNLFGSVAGALLLYTKLIHRLLTVGSADVGRVKRFLCWLRQSTTEHLPSLCLALDIFGPLPNDVVCGDRTEHTAWAWLASESLAASGPESGHQSTGQWPTSTHK